MTKEWPSWNLTWTYTPGRAIRNILSNISARMNYKKNTTLTLQPGLVSPATGDPEPGGAGDDSTPQATTANETRSISPSVTLTLANSIITGLQYSQTNAEARRTGNLTNSDQSGWLANMRFGFRVPRWLARLRSRIATELSYNSNVSTVCLIRTSAPECIVVSDSRRSEIRLGMDTGFSPSVRGGASFTRLVTDQRHTSSKFSQMVFTIFAQINFLAGQIR